MNDKSIFSLLCKTPLLINYNYIHILFIILDQSTFKSKDKSILQSNTFI